MDETVGESSRQTQQATAAAVSVAANADTKASNVKLLIKSSNQQYDDQIIESDMLWSVTRLKMHLFMTHPSKPPVLEQKLIYSGQLLNDKLLLKDVLRSYKDVYTQNHIIHLVYTPRTAACASTKADVSKKQNKQQANMTTTAASESSLRQRQVGTEQQQQQQQQQQQYANAAAMFVPQLTAAACPPYYGQNMLPFNMQLMATQQNAMQLWMQQVYSQYMDQCARLFSVNGVAATPGSTAAAASNAAWPTNPYIPFMPQTAFQTGNMSYPVIPASAFSAGVPAAAQATEPMAAPASVVAAAAPAVAAAVDEQPRPQVDAAAEPRFPLIAQEEVDNRDWLDSFFSITRLAIFLTILYFNSSPMRCLAVLIIASFIYLYHIGVLRFNRERNNNNINRNNNAQAQAPRQVQEQQQQQQQQQQQEHNADNDSSSEADDDDDASETSEEDEAARLVQAATTNNTSGNAAVDSLAASTEAHTNSFLATMRTFVITFFTSLLPETAAI